MSADRSSSSECVKTSEDLLEAIFKELRYAEKKFPGWPTDVVHAAAIVAEEAGELVQAALDWNYHREEWTTKMEKEAAQTAAMAMRFLFGIYAYKREQREE